MSKPLNAQTLTAYMVGDKLFVEFTGFYEAKRAKV